MFNSFTGTITGKFLNTVHIDTHGIEWELTVSNSTIDLLPAVGKIGRVYTYLVHTEDLMTLYGFASYEERTIFLSLIKVDGIGPKAAIKILSNITREELTNALEEGNLSRLEKVPGIGKKTGAKMILALKGKLTMPSETNQQTHSKEYGDVIQSLVSMGYDKRNCEYVILELTKVLNEQSEWKNLKPTEKEDMLFRKALIELAK
ncbi:MAG: Holliday junction branch migration protein RuvA [Treponema sp.]|nr:Holliday junction branch migration protein RuvA [Treponema sp.]